DPGAGYNNRDQDQGAKKKPQVAAPGNSAKNSLHIN
uniref:Dentin matrix, incisor (Fragments) n=1 Tax=Rattus norvegicus TaxID=10116 RepID=Q7M045_RAT